MSISLRTTGVPLMGASRLRASSSRDALAKRLQRVVSQIFLHGGAAAESGTARAEDPRLLLRGVGIEEV